MPPSPAEDFDIISHKSSSAIYGEWEKHSSALVVDTDSQVQSYLREHYPHMTITAVPTSNLPLIRFAYGGFATADLDTETDSVLRWRGFVPPAHRGGKGQLGDAVFFAKYHYTWLQEKFILYTVGSALQQMQYILKEPGPDENTLSHCAKSDALIKTAIEVLGGRAEEFVYVFDNYWTKSKELWDEVMKSSWDKVILDPKMKESLQDISSTFFDSKELYERYGVPWKRGLIFAGPPGNGKTISIKALMKTLYSRKDPIPTLYVKNAPQTYHLDSVFRLARTMTPCLLVMEDIETIVTPATRSYFFNEVDGLTNNGGLLMVASTNYLDKLDPGLSKRPSRFDRKFIFPLPDEHERTLYAEFWREKLSKANTDLPFPHKLCPAMAKITDKFSFAYLQEAFIASLLVIARDAMGKANGTPTEDLDAGNYDVTGGGDDDLSAYKLWRVFKEEVTTLRENMGSEDGDAAYLPLPLGEVQRSETPSKFRGPESSFYTAAEPSTVDLRGAGASMSLPVRDTKPEHHHWENPSRGLQDKPDSIAMAASGYWKRQYMAQSAYEWRV